jgi:hypothetical protein
MEHRREEAAEGGALSSSASEGAAKLPADVFGVVVGHQNRHLALDPKTGAMFVGVGSAGNIALDEIRLAVAVLVPQQGQVQNACFGTAIGTRSGPVP